MSNENLLIWDQVCESDPAQLRKVEQRGGFLSIDAYPQIKKATEVFGPMGLGFGLKDVSYQITEGDISNRDNPSKRGEILILRSTFWYKYPDTNVIGDIPMFNQAEFGTAFSNNETFKKLITNSISKALSYLGFNYDVFCGSWDDDPYKGRPEIPATSEQKDRLKLLLSSELFSEKSRASVMKLQVNANWTRQSVSNSIKGCEKYIISKGGNLPKETQKGCDIDGIQEEKDSIYNKEEKNKT